MNTKIVSSKKLICYSRSYYLFSKGTKLYCSKGIGEKEILLGILPVSSAKKLISNIRLFARALRLEPRCGIFVNEDVAIVSYHGAIYRVDCKNSSIQLEHKFRSEMNNPLCFTKIEDIAGFSDGIYYGEYFLNHASAEVRIFKREENGTWNIVYTFPSGSIYHVHGIIPYPKKDCVYVLTGDKDSESGIFEFRDNFTKVKTIVSGKQAYRACVALPIDNGLLYTTDTPLEENHLYQLDFNSKEIKSVCKIAGPCIYGKVLSDNEMVFSTSVEPDSRLTGLKYEFTYKLGEGVQDRNSHLYYVKWDGSQVQVNELFKVKKDIIPMGAGQFGTMMFPAGEGQLFVTGQALRKYDNKTILIDRL